MATNRHHLNARAVLGAAAFAATVLVLLPLPASNASSGLLSSISASNGGSRTLYGARNAHEQWHGNTPVVRVQGLDAGFTRESYRSGDTATLNVATDATRFSLQVFGLGREFVRTMHDSEMVGIPVTKPESIDWQSQRNSPGTVQVPVGNWPSGVYWVQLSDGYGRIGYAPLIVRPNRIGEHRVAVVLPTNT